MTEDEKGKLIALIAGVELAVVHLARVCADKCSMPVEEMAASFSRTADAVPPGTHNAAAISAVLRHVASGLSASASSGGQAVQQLRDLMH